MAAIAGSGTSLSLKQTSFTSPACERSYKSVPSSAESPRIRRIECGLSSDAVQDLCAAPSISVVKGGNSEPFSTKGDEFCNGRKGRLKNLWTRRHGSSNALSSDNLGKLSEESTGWFNVQDPRVKEPPWRGRVFEANQLWEVLRQDLHFCDWKARRDVLTMKNFHDKVVDVLNPMAKDWKSMSTLKEELSALQTQLSVAHEQVHLSEARVARTLEKLSEMEALVNDRLLKGSHSSTVGLEEKGVADVVGVEAVTATPSPPQRRNNGLIVSGPIQEYSPSLKNFWYPVAFTDDIKEDTMVPFDCFEEPWVLFRGQDGRVGCVRNSCAHRACPLHLGAVKDGRIQCPYHGRFFPHVQVHENEEKVAATWDCYLCEIAVKYRPVQVVESAELRMLSVNLIWSNPLLIDDLPNLVVGCQCVNLNFSCL